MKNIAVIPARGGSKRLPNKNILSLGGIPLIAHSIVAAQKSSHCIDAIYVSTDDPEIKKIAIAYGANVVDRPPHLSGDLEPTVTALKNVLENIDIQIDNVFLLQPTNPLRPPNLIEEAFQVFEKNKADSLMTVSLNHQKFGKIKDNMFIPFNYIIGQRSQDLEPLYFENGLLYIMKAALILQEKLVGPRHFPMIVAHPFAVVDIDHQCDLDYATYLYQKYNIQNTKNPI